MKKTILASIIFFLLPLFAKAEEITSIWHGRNTITCFEDGPCSLCDALKLVANASDFLAQLAVVLAGGLIIWGGIKILISSGDTKKNFGEAKKIITSAVWGVIIVSGSWIIVNTALQVLSGDTNPPWTTIDCG
mgnify:CR=1 FL=1